MPGTGCLWVALLTLAMFSQAYAEQGAKKIPPVEETIRIVLEAEKARGARAVRDTVYLARQYYYRILSKTEQLAVSEEVKGHFEKAVSKAEEKFAEGGDDVSQSDITKLRLGLAGANNDITELKSEVEQATLSLEKLMGWDPDPEVKTSEDKIRPVEFAFSSLEDYRKSPLMKTESGNPVQDIADKTLSAGGKKAGNPSPDIKRDHEFDMHMAFIRVREAREKLKLAGDTKKMTRAMLVTEVANYDFGIGGSGDLFEALIIYTRVLRGHYESIYNFNIAVAELDKVASPRRIF
jgi:hypothetical protein